MWVTVRRPGGRMEEIDLPDDMDVDIGDLLDDGSVVLDLAYSDDFDDDMTAMDMWDEDY